VLAHLPHIQRLVLAGARPEISSPAGVLHDYYDQARTENIMKCIRKYIPPASCQYLPPVKVFMVNSLMSGLVAMFISARDPENGCRLMYTAEFQY